MRIVALNLIAYGHFDNKVLRFGNKPGFHLIYGDNEAGKSTALRALSSVLFGYPHGVIDGYKYDPKDIALGADLISKSEQELSFVRKRRGQKVLVTSDGKTLDQSAITAFLGGIDIETFERVFALDHTRLHEHAKSLLSEGGTLGITIAEAGSGIAGLKGILGGLGSRRSDLFLSGGSRPTLNRLLSQLADTKARARRYTVSLSEYKKRAKEIEECIAAISEARTSIADISKEIRQLERIQRNLPLKTQHAAIVERLTEITDAPDLPDDVTQRRIKAESEKDNATADLEIANSAISELEEKIGAVAINEEVLLHTDEIKALAQKRPVVENAEADLPKREAELKQCKETARDLLAKAELGGTPELLGDILPSAIKRKAIETLIAGNTSLTGQLDTASQVLRNAEHALEAANEKAKISSPPIDIVELELAWRAAEKLGPITEQIGKHRRTVERNMKALNEGITAIGIGTGGLSALRSFIAPAQKTLERYKAMFSDIDAKSASSHAERERLKEEIKDFSQQIDRLSNRGAVLTADDVSQRREQRDQTWSLIREGFVKKSPSGQKMINEWAGELSVADHFERQVAEADAAADTVCAHVEDATELSIAQRSKADRDEKLGTASEAIELLVQEKKVLWEEWAKLWGTLTTGLQSPDEMSEWIRRRDALLKDGERTEALEAEIEQLDASSTAAANRLVDALKKIAEPVTATEIDGLRQAADTAIKRNAAVKSRFEKINQEIETLELAHASANDAVDTLTSKIEAHAKKWQVALATAGLRPQLSVDAASLILGFMNELDRLKGEIASLTHRIETMREDCTCFESRLASLAPLVSAIAQETPTATCRRLEAALESAQASDTERKKLQGQVEIQKKAKKTADDKLQRSNAELEGLCRIAGCSSPENLAAIEEKAGEKRRLIGKREEMETRLRETGDGHSLEELFAECDGIVADEVPSKLTDLGRNRDELSATLEQTVERRAELNNELDTLMGGDQACDYTQTAAMIEADATKAANSYVETTVLEVLLRQAIEVYRDRNQGPILARAKTLFSELTDGAYSGLRADVDDKGIPVLIAEHPTRGSLDIPALSDGTVDPLYLALRLGAIQEYNATREPLPFIADDLLLSLGNRRARATLKTLGGIAKDGQVLFFTHHEHMIELAREVLHQDVLHEHAL